MATPFVVHDPVHGYIPIAPHERAVIDHPITQRLRRINQTGLAEYVYPEARTSRFAHSIGAMHMASRFLIAAIENASPTITAEFLADIRKHYKDKDLELKKLKPLVRPPGPQALASARSTFQNPELQNSEENRDLIGLIETGVRFAALFHDLGHLPFSHDFELALRQFGGRILRTDETTDKKFLDFILVKRAQHEIVGRELADAAFAELAEGENDRRPLQLAKTILQTSSEYGLEGTLPMSALGWLHSLVDGDLDADRADYLLRDGRALGLDFAHYDVDRLVPHIRLEKTKDLGYLTAVGEHGLSPLESFFLSRTRSHHVLIRHHKVAQVAAALRHATAVALEKNAGGAPRFLKDLRLISKGDFAISADHAEVLRRFATYDDAWWMTVLRSLDECGPDSEARTVLQNCLELVLRRSRTFTSVWKRRGDLTDAQVADINKLQALRPELESQLADEGIFLVLYDFKPYRRIEQGENKGKSLIHIRTKLDLFPASALSPVFRALDEMWGQEVHGHVFATKKLSVAEALERVRAGSEEKGKGL